MTALLVSVRDAEEARMAVEAGADMIDAKDPDLGALGALAPETIEAIRQAVAARRLVTAVIGDHHTVADAVAASETVAATGVDVVKVGLYPDAKPSRLATVIAERLANRTRLVAVLLADLDVDFGLVPLLARVGFYGVMLDTAGKAGGLLSHKSLADLGDFVRLGEAHGLVTGLAGSLRAGDIAGLKRLRPGLLGFRGGVCVDGNRTGPLDRSRIEDIAGLLKTPMQKKG